MRSAFSLLDSAVSSANGQMDSGNSLDPIRVKAVFYALCFGDDAPSTRAANSFVGCFYTTETRTRTVEVTGDGQKVNGLVYKDLSTATNRTLSVAGIFVQIGQVPATAWLKDTPIRLNEKNEIEVDVYNKTSVAGVFAAGDVTSSPYKQIVIAMGDGAKAALSAFDYLIRR